MKDKRGFVLTETLVVTTFLITIFTFVYVSIIPLLGQYDDLSYRKSDIDIVYKLYNVRKMLYKSSMRGVILNSDFLNIKCSDMVIPSENAYCNAMMNFLELDNGKYIIVYTSNIQNHLANFLDLPNDQDHEMHQYITNYLDENQGVLILLDKKNHTIAHLLFH